MPCFISRHCDAGTTRQTYGRAKILKRIWQHACNTALSVVHSHEQCACCDVHVCLAPLAVQHGPQWFVYIVLMLVCGICDVRRRRRSLAMIAVDAETRKKRSAQDNWMESIEDAELRELQQKGGYTPQHTYAAPDETPTRAPMPMQRVPSRAASLSSADTNSGARSGASETNTPQRAAKKMHLQHFIMKCKSSYTVDNNKVALLRNLLQTATERNRLATSDELERIAERLTLTLAALPTKKTCESATSHAPGGKN